MGDDWQQCSLRYTGLHSGNMLQSNNASDSPAFTCARWQGTGRDDLWVLVKLAGLQHSQLQFRRGLQLRSDLCGAGEVK